MLSTAEIWVRFAAAGPLVTPPEAANYADELLEQFYKRYEWDSYHRYWRRIEEDKKRG